MKILGIDPAAKTGFAFEDTEKPDSLVFGTWDLGSKRPLESQHQALEELIEHKIKSLGVDTIAIENAGFGSHNPSVQAMHNERLAIARLVAARHDCKFITLNPMTIKVFATGNGHAKKEQMVAAAKKFYHLSKISDDEADAVFILELAKRPDCWPQPAAKKSMKRRVKTTKVLKNAKELF